jgi:hypothetical protein
LNTLSTSGATRSFRANDTAKILPLVTRSYVTDCPEFSSASHKVSGSNVNRGRVRKVSEVIDSTLVIESRAGLTLRTGGTLGTIRSWNALGTLGTGGSLGANQPAVCVESSCKVPESWLRRREDFIAVLVSASVTAITNEHEEVGQVQSDLTSEESVRDFTCNETPSVLKCYERHLLLRL